MIAYLIFTSIAVFAGLSGAAMLIAFVIVRARENRRQLRQDRAMLRWMRQNYFNELGRHNDAR